MTSFEEKQEIAKKLLWSAPLDAFDVILSNLKEILPSLSDDDWIETMKSQHPSFHYQEQAKGEMDAFGQELEDAVKLHVQKFYAGPHVVVTHSVTSQQTKGEYKICVSAQRNRFHQFNIGSWIGTYTLSPVITSDRSCYVLTGTMNVHTQAFEGKGNFQNTSKFILSETNVKNHAESVIQNISTFETDCLNQLNRFYDETGDQLKRLRRIMPITRQKFSWNVSGQKGLHELGHHLRLVKK